MSVNISIYITNAFNEPVFGAIVSFFNDPTASAVATATTDSTGRSGTVLNPGKYSISIQNGLLTTNVPTYVVKYDIPQNFSGTEMITGTPSQTSGPFVPKRFRLTKYESSNMGKSTGLAQQFNCRI